MSKFDTHGGYFAPKDYMRVNEGGSHEENPNGGVQIGVDPEGNPNLLEEGEPVYKDYVYSDNIEAERAFLEQNHLPTKYEGKLYSKIADDLFTEAEERPLDPISRNGLEVLLGRLADAQEGQKQAKEQRDLEDELANLSPEELDQLEAMLAQEQSVGTDNPMYGEGPVGAQGEPGIPPEQVMGPAEQMPVEGMPMMGCGGKISHKYPDGGLLLDPAYVTAKYRPIRVNSPRFVTGPGMPPMDLTPRRITDWNWSTDYDDYINPAYVFANGPTNPSVRGSAQLIPPLSLRGLSNGATSYSVISDNVSLPGAIVTADSPTGYNFEYRVDGPREGLRGASRQTPAFNYSYDDVDSDSASASSVDNNTSTSEINSGNEVNLLPTWPRYAGAVGSGLLGLYNAFQQPDRYTATRILPDTPEGRINLQNQVYNPVDQNMVANAQIAQGNATNRALRNSGLGPSSAAAILAADNNLTGNLGTGFLQAWDANNQRRNAVIAANNQAEAQRAQFDANLDYYKSDALNKAAMYNAQNDLMIQRLNNQAEADKYTAISNQISNGLQALSGIGQENFAMNQINTNPANLGYRYGPNGQIYYFNTVTREWEQINSNPKTASTAKTSTPPLSGPLFDIKLGLPYSNDPFMGYNKGLDLAFNPLFKPKKNN